VFIYYLVGARYRWSILLAASYIFYASWKAEYLPVIVGATIVNYYAALLMAGESLKTKRRKYLVVSLISGLGLLFLFKYFDFFAISMNDVLHRAHISFEFPLLDLVMPIGLSFYTLQTLGYILDIYHGKRPPERHFGIFAVYVSFFPIVLSGPIERSMHLLPQLRHKHEIRYSYENISQGAKLIIMGLFYKLVVADRVAIYVDAVYANTDRHFGLTFLAATVFYSFQIYCDFAGYSNVTIGSAKLLGIDILKNFRRPYIAASVKECWRRWHISLSNWLRDYIFLPVDTPGEFDSHTFPPLPI
jgi:D-alanyl-lipoteichoic acid acyltransferase DltB (MBOAT superfamily)